MATYTAATYNFNLGTDAPYQALWGDVDSHIRSLGGWTYVSQTGDNNPASTATGSASTYPAFRVYSTTASGTTWYVRIDYGHVAGGPSFKVQIGTSVNGSGTLGGQTSTQATYSCSDTSANQTLHIGQDTGRLMVFLALATGSSNCAGVSLHGSVDGTGAMNGGMEQYGLTTNQTHSAQFVPASGSIMVQQTPGWPCAFGTLATQAFGGVTPLGIPQLWDTTGATNPTLACLIYATNDLTSNTTTTVSLYGSTRTYIISNCNGALASSTNTKSGWRYD